jgi:hypothetical protein
MAMVSCSYYELFDLKQTKLISRFVEDEEPGVRKTRHNSSISDRTLVGL